MSCYYYDDYSEGRGRSYGGVTAVAVVGRENEPLYLRGDLGDSSASARESQTTVAARQEEVATGAARDERIDRSDEEDPSGGGGSEDVDGSEPSKGGKGLLGRLKVKVKGAAGAGHSADGSEEGRGHRDRGDSDGDSDFGGGDDDDDDHDDPFGFFENNSDARRRADSSSSSSHAVPAMSLTQQLVLHASLDRFEELASQSNVRWRMPGSSNAATAMWIGLLCQVEERWNVYGYLTNTGIKFMILLENIYLNQDGSRHQQDCAPPLINGSLPSPLSNSGSRESDLKQMFAQLHELYVRHTMNPFSKLRSAIQSRAFDEGIVQMAQIFNASALEKVLRAEEGQASGDGAKNGSGRLEWM